MINFLFSRINILKRYLCDLYHWRGSSPRFGEILWISPKDIKGFVNICKTHNFKDSGSIHRGDWDLDVQPLEKKERIHALIRMYQEGKNTEAEQEFRNLLIRHGWIGEQCEIKVKRAWNIFESIKKNGFIVKQQRLMHSLIKDKSSIRVAITRKGEFVWLGSNHRMAAALALNLEKVAVMVQWRHYEWQKFRHDLWKKIKHGQISKENISHPDLRAIINNI